MKERQASISEAHQVHPDWRVSNALIVDKTNQSGPHIIGYGGWPACRPIDVHMHEIAISASLVLTNAEQSYLVLL
nr:MAG: hypothetical protein DIU57_14930 [Pseudomonadota bacterium]